MALVIKKNSVNLYLFNTITNRVVYPRIKDSNMASHILNLIPDKFYNTVSYDKNVEYSLEHHVSGKPFLFSNVMLDGRLVRTYMSGIASRKKAIKYVNELMKYGIKLF